MVVAGAFTPVQPLNFVLGALGVAGIIGAALAYTRGTLAKSTIELYESNNAELRETVTKLTADVSVLKLAVAECRTENAAWKDKNDLLVRVVENVEGGRTEFREFVAGLAMETRNVTTALVRDLHTETAEATARGVEKGFDKLLRKLQDG